MSAPSPVPTEKGILQFLQICDNLYPADAVEAPVEQQRRWYDALCARFDRPLPPDIIFADGMVQRIPIRRYRPRKIITRTILLYIHGGGFVVGSLESHHAICAEIADFAGAELVSVDYRLAPEYRWPAQTDDGFAVLKHLLAAGNKVVLIGDSAGGNLAAGLALRARDEALSGVVGQVLIYPTLGGDMDAGSYLEMAAAPGLTTADVAYYREILRAPEGNEIAEPLRASSVADLPPAFITVAHFDPLRDDGRHYAARLSAEGIEVWFREEPQMVHAWLRARHMSDGARDGFRAVCEAIGHFAML
ncbi:alpha/beta hydrolase [Rhizobium binae]|uniref:Acetyl esterase n=1 Tax=Rhizobium binae TaxID=1138190 RepID=A0ABV2MIY1_9HYPH|nr:alpha/beta hydrolase [Rhizobium binae]NKL50249.1 alpha/beta hydrolase fold domain-containing protein [Rhizobium leguminosarum bv. viciae]MBX4936148.1 alpha/beta hydrolase [Rhizobium binae]MBX4942187.1 alpha/beta hydrolase [Rhizobium binae]MBX4962332.1 alpha/beta hydrolase [Rhizobium binae]MBX4978078.1 alpha/beta hydrolase [Rhizobium binae]